MDYKRNGTIFRNAFRQEMSNMTMSNETSYPDISDIIAAQQKRRLDLRVLSWEEKVAIIENMRTMMPRGMWKDRDTGIIDLNDPE